MKLNSNELRKAAIFALNQYGDAKHKDDQHFWLGVYSVLDYLAESINPPGTGKTLKPPSP